MSKSNSIRLGFKITQHPNRKLEKTISFHFTVFTDDRIGLVVKIAKKEYQMVFFENMQDLKVRGAGFGLTSENIMFTSRIIENN